MASSGGSFHRQTAEGKYVYLRTSSSSIRQRSSLMGPQVMASLQRSSTATSRRTVCWMPEFWKCSRSSEMLGHRSENSTWRTTWAILNNTWLKQHLIKWHLINTILGTSIHSINKSSVLAWPASHEWPRFQRKPGPGHVMWSCPLKETWIWPQTRFCELVRIKFLSVKSHSIKCCFNWLLIKCLMIKCWIKCHAAKNNNTKTRIFLFACFLFLLVTFLLLVWLNFLFVLEYYMFIACWKCSNDLFFQWKGSCPCRSKCWSTGLGNPKGRATENEQNRIWNTLCLVLEVYFDLQMTSKCTKLKQNKTKNTLLFTHSAFALSLVVVPSVASGDQYTIQQA